MLIVMSCERSYITDFKLAKDMPITLVPFGGITAITIKSRAEIPSSASMTVNGTNLDCNDINISQIASVIGSSYNDLGVLCQSSLVNKWSGYSPREFYISSGTMLDRLKTPYSLGDFAGYDHAALSPYLLSHTADFSIMETAGTTSTTVNASVMLGQINWWLTDLYFGSVIMEASIGGSVVTTQIINLSQSTFLTTSSDFSATINTTGWTTAHTVNLAFYFGKDAAHSNTKLCSLPGLSSTDIIIGVNRIPRIGTFLASSGLAATLGKSSAVLITTPTDLTLCYVTMGTSQTISVNCHGVDTNNDGVGDLTLFSSGRFLYWRVNGGSWWLLNGITMAIDNSSGGTFGAVNISIPAITYNDIIDVEVR